MLTILNPDEAATVKFARLKSPTGLVRVTVTGELTCPALVCGNSIQLGCAATAPGVPPVPLSGTLASVCPPAAIVSVPVYAKARGGEKTTPAVQLAPAARLVPQVFCARLKGAVAVRVIAFAVEPPVLAIITVCAALLAPGGTMAKTSCPGSTLIPAAVCPVPLNGTLTAATPAVEDETASEAVAPPAAAGVKITCTVQLLPLARVAPQVVVPREKLAAESPVI